MFKNRKRIIELEETNKKLGDELEKACFEIDRLNSELKNQKRIAFDMNEEILGYRQERTNLLYNIQDQAKAIKKLKSLCTRNGIDYKKLFNKE